MKKRILPLFLTLSLLCSLLAVPASATDPAPFYCPKCSSQTCTERIDLPTCTKSGGFYRTCASCGFETMMVGSGYNDYHKPALGHDYQNGTCSRCGDTRQEAIAKLPQSPAATQTGNRDSGSTSMKKLSQAEISRLLADNPLTLPANVFTSNPSCIAPFAAGAVKTEVLQGAVNRLNLLRRLAGLPDVALDMSLCENAQHSAVIQAYYGALNHFPNQPEGMSDAFYRQAYSASSSSNLAAGRTLTGSVDLWMEDSDRSNVDRLGHRRWQLNPTMGKVGFGYAEAKNTLYRTYAAEKVFDTSGNGCDYDFVAWPASGNFPSELFNSDIAWSVSLNPEQYQIPRRPEMLENVTVTLTRQADGKVWTFHGDNYPATDSDAYFNVDTANYGIPNCIIFRPDGIQKYAGRYTVQIKGLTASNGQSVKDFTYEVNFFDKDNTTSEQPEQPEQPVQGSAFRDVPAGAYYADAVAWAVKKGITNGIGNDLFGSDNDCTRAQIVTFLWRAAGSPAPKSASSFSDVSASSYYAKAVAWAIENGITEGTGNGRFSPDKVCSRAQAVTFLARALNTKAAGAADFSDVPANSYYADAVDWAAESGVTEGVGGGKFAPNNDCTRAQIVTFLFRAYQGK